MDTYNPKEIGTLMAWGADHLVYRYGNESVLKFSKFDFILGRHGRVKAIRDYEVCRDYFGSRVLLTEFMRAPRGSRLAKRQVFLVGRNITKEDMENPRIQSQFMEILAAYRNMIADGVPPVDLIGGKGIFTRTLANIFVSTDGRLYLIDTTLIDVDIPILRTLVKIFGVFVLSRQEATIAHFLGEGV